ncbi:MAG: glycerol-3-phosphate acyltransferase [Plectolyngbya sp. WJT66-NPBG17]|jgi:pyruvate,water dikinase|nr:glycerol-3-phosphate acyltransferase [Plectolyngbya sp. WJT66-NPBG17]
MTLMQVWGSLLIFVLCPILGGLPLISWITRALTRKRLSQLGTGNVSVSAAFYHGGKVAGILAVLSEALKGIAAVLLARSFFPERPEWEIVALIALVYGRYFIGKGAGTTNVVWGYVVHDPIVSFLVFLIGGIGFTILRERRSGKFGVLILFPLVTALRHSQETALIVCSIALASFLWWIYNQIPDDLDLKPNQVQRGSQTMFQFLREDRSLLSLDQVLKAEKVGQKAATLSALKRSGYPVPDAWILLPGDDPKPLIQAMQPSREHPLIVRSSAIGEDSESASAAGQYESIANITDRDLLLPAILRCLESYEQDSAVKYRRDRDLLDASMVVLVQQQVRGVFSGVAFSRDPIARQGNAVLIEALPGNADRVVSGQVTPESYLVNVQEVGADWILPEDATLEVEGEGTVPSKLIQQVAYLARHLEEHFHGVPQDIEWSFDGETLWVLQSRSITTLFPIWTRKIAAEVIPGAIRPLTWSINRPLTCGVWGKIFTIVLGDRASGLGFNETATLHYSHAYFNASLLGQIFRRMGLPAESLEFLTRGAKFNKPPLQSTIANLPGLSRLLYREVRLEKDFARDDRLFFRPMLLKLRNFSLKEETIALFTQQVQLSDEAVHQITEEIDQILELLERATYYSILAPLSAALRKSIFRVPDEALDNRDTPEVAALRALSSLATSARSILANSEPQEDLFAQLAQTTEGQTILRQFDQLLDQYGYLSEVGTDIAVPTWREQPQPVQELFKQFCLNPSPETTTPHIKNKGVQRRITLKGKVTEIYSRLLAELRWRFIAIEHHWLTSGILTQSGDLFFLTFNEIQQALSSNPELRSQFPQIIEQRRSQFDHDHQLSPIPQLIYGDDPPTPNLPTWQASTRLQGIGASAGQVEGTIRVLRSLNGSIEIDRETILVVPYTDSGWMPVLARVGGLIAEVGGRLSHGAIVAREYRIPAVMDVPHATEILQDGQRVRINGQLGTIEIL